GEIRKFTEEITFNIHCELKDVVYYVNEEKKHKPCVRVPEISQSTTPGKTLDPKELFFRCGAFSWDIESIQQHAIRNFSDSLQEFVEVSSPSNQVGGPWRTAVIKKMIILNKRLRYISYEIVINKENEVHTIIVTHHIGRKVSVVNNFDEHINSTSNSKFTTEKQSIKIKCSVDQKFPIFLQN
ncbi:Bgt-51568, partial [Blumeria graminis f. sp. tritici]